MARFRPWSELLPGEASVDRWTMARKQECLRRIRAGEITRIDAMRTWGISVEELDGWLSAERRAGQRGLKATVVAPVQERLL